MAKESVNKIIQRFYKILIDEGIKVDRMILYGSYAKGYAEEESDIDIAVISKNFGKDRVEEGMMLFRLAGDLDVRIEPVPISLESYENNTWVPLIYEIRKNGEEVKLSHV